MAGTPIGRILLMPKGNYSGTAVYYSLDWVRYNGSAWVCTTDNTTGIAPAIGVPEWQVLAQDGTVSGTVDWSNVNFKPFDTVGSGLDVDVSNTLKLDISMLTGSNISYDNSGSGAASNNVQDALDELFRGGGGGGLLPYFFIDSEAGSTVTVSVPDGSTITPTAAGSGHWECSVPMYGTYTIHSVLAGQGDATVSVNVDDVKQYHITDNHFDFTINVTAPNGSTIRITGGDETYTGTGTGSSQAFAVHAPSTTYTIAVTMDGNTKSDTVTSAATTGQSDSVMIDFGTINVSVAADFVTAGSTITCVNGGTSCTPKTAASTLVFRVPSTGTWTISGEISGTPYSTTATVTALGTPVPTSLQTVPDGSTVLPTDDIPTWLLCGGLSSTGYTTLSQVLADSTTLLALMSDNNAVDYLVRSKSWISGKGLVPTMTSNTLPSGECSGSGYRSPNDFYRAFDDNSTTYWGATQGHTSGEYLVYMFEQPQIVRKFSIKNYLHYGMQTATLYASNTGGNDYVAIKSNIALSDTDAFQDVAVDNDTPYKYWKLVADTGYNASELDIYELQFYSVDGNGITDDSTAMTDIGANNYCADTLLDDADWCDAIANSTYFESVLNAKVPTMTGYTTPSGEVANMGDNSYPAWKAFDGTTSMAYVPVSNRNNPFYYKFTSNVRCVVAVVGGYPLESNVRLSKFKIQASPDNSTWVDLSLEITNTATSTGDKQKIILNNSNEYLYYAMTATQTSAGGYEIETIQFYGREDV